MKLIQLAILDQNCFLNLVIKISTNLSPQELLKVTQKVENDLGRKREITMGPENHRP